MTIPWLDWLLGFGVVGLGVGLIYLCRALPSLEKRSTSSAYTDTGSTRLGAAITPQVAGHAGRSGIFALAGSHDAFAARVLLARTAERSLDLQYYIWNKDRSGTLMYEAVREAAERGVRVRLLLDDNNTSGLDELLSALNAHRNIEIRLFNPFVVRRFRWIGYLTDFFRLNRRMHNKSMTADNQVTIVGGRNIADEYFGAADSIVFDDLDVLAIGPVVNEVSNNFDLYWASGSSHPVDRLLPKASRSLLAELEAEAEEVAGNPATAPLMTALHDAPIVRELLEGRLALEWTEARMVSDDPLKGLGLAPARTMLSQKLVSTIGEPAESLELVSAYFVPTAAGVAALVALAERGVRIRVLTNSLEATDVALVHAGYAKRRMALLRAGIELRESQRLQPQAPTRGRFRIRRRVGLRRQFVTALHAKTFAVDRGRVFVGSFNFDPRSAAWNTELGFLIDSPSLAKSIEADFDSGMHGRAYQVRLTSDGRVCWIEHRQDTIVRHDVEPGTTAWQRGWVWFMSLTPIDWLL